MNILAFLCSMDFTKFQSFINDYDSILTSAKSASQTQNERILSRMVKITEEIGELSDEVLAYIGDQRESKLEEQKDLEGEFADVIITKFLLAKTLNVNIPKALETKTKIIAEKHNKELKEQQ